MGGVNTLMWALEADTVEYGEWKTGVRTEGITYALFSFTRKMGQAVGGAAAAYTIGFGGYVAEAASQPDSAVTAIRIAAGVVPAVVIGIALAIMFAYPLTESRFRELVREVAQRRVARQAEAAAPRSDATAPTRRHDMTADDARRDPVRVLRVGGRATSARAWRRRSACRSTRRRSPRRRSRTR